MSHLLDLLLDENLAREESSGTQPPPGLGELLLSTCGAPGVRKSPLVDRLACLRE